MTTDNRTTRATAATRPVLLIVDADPQDRAVTESTLTRRFGPDYQVLAAGTPQGGLDAQQRLADHGGDVALVAADLHLPGIDGVEFLERAHVLHPDSWRVLLVTMDRYHTRVPFTELAALQRRRPGPHRFLDREGMGHPGRVALPQVQEALSAWTIGHRPSRVVYRIVGKQWAPRSHELRDTLTRNSVPFDFYAADSQAGRQFIREFSIDVRRLPAVIHHDGSVQHDPSFADVAASHGIQTRPLPEVYNLAIVGAGAAELLRPAPDGFCDVAVHRRR
jgi:thioredoxin reductase (NADPH)